MYQEYVRRSSIFVWVRASKVPCINTYLMFFLEFFKRLVSLIWYLLDLVNVRFVVRSNRQVFFLTEGYL